MKTEAVRYTDASGGRDVHVHFETNELRDLETIPIMVGSHRLTTPFIEMVIALDRIGYEVHVEQKSDEGKGIPKRET